jgi:hypothetical protein
MDGMPLASDAWFDSPFSELGILKGMIPRLLALGWN